MRELRKHVESLDSPKEELDTMEEMKIEDVLMGLKGLKQEEVFSFLGKNNFTPTETEEWLKMMSSAGFGNYDQITSAIDTSEMEQLQLSIDSNFDNFQSLNSHITHNAYNIKNTSGMTQNDLKMRIKTESMVTSVSSKSFLPYPNDVKNTVEAYSYPNIKKEKDEELFVENKSENNQKMKFQLPSFESEYRQQANWPKYPGPAAFMLADGHLENLREEEIVTSTVDKISNVIRGRVLEHDNEPKYFANNTYVIQSPQMDVADVADKPKPIKLLIKRVEGEDEVSNTSYDVDNTITIVREKSKRIRSSCTRRKSDELSPPTAKRKRCAKKSLNRSKTDSTVSRKKEVLDEELDFPFANTVHQDDDFVYPSLDLSDDEVNDVYNFNQIDDETWTPKIKMKINEVKTDRPTRDRKRNSAIAKCLEAAALKRAESITSSSDAGTTKKSVKKYSKNRNTKGKTNISNQVHGVDAINFFQNPINGIICDDIISNRGGGDYLFDELTAPKTSHIDVLDTIPSTSFCTLDIANELSILDCSSSSDSMNDTSIKRSSPKSNKKSNNPKIRRNAGNSRLIAPKTCKLIQTTPNTSSGQHNQQKRAKNESAQTSSDKKSPNSPHVTKRGKPKKGMATAKQRLGKILKMHKMFF